MSATLESRLSVWYLADPDLPRKAGEVSLLPGGRGLQFAYDADWERSGFALSGDLPLGSRQPLVSHERDVHPGAIDDSLPDRWGERAIRFLERPARATALDFLYYAGDRRFGCLGFSIDQNVYAPHPSGPLPTVDSVGELQDLIGRIELNEPLTEQEKLIASSTKTMGGAHPKALVLADGREWIAKFPRGQAIDTPLVEYATLALAQQANIDVPARRLVQSPVGHVMLIERFDRHGDNGSRRRHALSAKTVLLYGVDAAYPPAGELSYGALATFIQQSAAPGSQLEKRRELFRRMAFNILIENTDDHEKNHAFTFDGRYWQLAPAYDVLPLTANAGEQQMIVGTFGAQGTLQNALSQCRLFGLSREEAIEAWFEVAAVVDKWTEVFRACGVSGADIDYLKDFIDEAERVKSRSRALLDSLPPEGAGKGKGRGSRN
jgi:serine/threonine-protein kinase HipA